ncbi:hypothetical protein ACJIZ3_018999 [Penstemon smallii]|uniref:Uncharacterized protein n=1 Tax=Penstemon smallii TaxID=265156 RepID=A0ABD3T1F0_9LAMI
MDCESYVSLDLEFVIQSFIPEVKKAEQKSSDDGIYTSAGLGIVAGLGFIFVPVKLVLIIIRKMRSVNKS